jgi:formate dehydrogenase major subunit
VPGLGATFGRGAATTAQQDLKNADAILIMGSSMAENHPVGFQWVMEARERGAKVIHVDPRFTRTSAMADIWVPLRAGSDIVFLGGLIRYVLENGREFREYVVHYTNASTLLRDDFRDTEDLDGLFSGWDGENKTYNPESWGYRSTGGEADAHIADRDPTLQDPRCVFRVLKRHFARYTPEMVEQACGVSKEVFLKTAEAFVSASGPEKTGAICYALGWTQHSNGVQVIRSAAILQLLLGNIGRPGGGILALRGHASIQGSTDIPTLFDLLPGYLPMPAFGAEASELSQYIRKHQPRTGLWANFDKYVVSLLKAWYGEAATAANDFGFKWLPRITGDHSHFGYWYEMLDGKLEGLFVMGQNPAVGAPNGRLQRSALARLKWLVVRDMTEIETATFWKDSPEVERGEVLPEQIATEVFLFPAAGSTEKDGTFTNTQRLLQYRDHALDPPDDARSEAWFMYHLGRRLKAKANKDARVRNLGLNALTWDYPVRGAIAEPEVESVLQEINGRRVADGKLLRGFEALQNEGSTACGCWIYSGVFPNPNENKAKRREARDYLGHGWGFAWPNDCRIIYNRASARPDGRPWSEKKKLVWWDEQEREWTGLDTPDFDKTTAPDATEDLAHGHGVKALGGARPFVLHADGLGWLYAPSGLNDGPLPAHYEPLETLFENMLYAQTTDPAAQRKERPENRYAESPGDPRFPYILTTYRLTEHHTAGGMTRTLSHLAELQPELFVEVSPELAADAGLEHGEWATISTPRGAIGARVLVTRRMHPLWIEGRRVHQVGLPYHWGYRGVVKGEVVNDLLAVNEEPNVRIMEAKALVCDVAPGRVTRASRRDRGTECRRPLF